MAGKLPPTPVGVPPGHSFWNDWYEKLRALINDTVVNFSDLNFTGSNLTSIATRNHNDLQNIQGGSSGQYYHLTSAQSVTAIAFTGLAGNGVIVKTGTDTYAVRTLTGTANRIVVTNGDGVSGAPTFDIGTDVVTLTGSQTLSNKTLTSPIINAAVLTHNGTQLNAFPGAATNYEIVNRNGSGVDIYVNSAGTLGLRITSTGAGTFAAGITTGSTTLHTTSVALTNGAAAAAGTLTNAPTAGNPTKWAPVNDNGTIRYIPMW